MIKLNKNINYGTHCPQYNQYYFDLECVDCHEKVSQILYSIFIDETYYYNLTGCILSTHEDHKSLILQLHIS